MLNIIWHSRQCLTQDLFINVLFNMHNFSERPHLLLLYNGVIIDHTSVSPSHAMFLLMPDSEIFSTQRNKLICHKALELIFEVYCIWYKISTTTATNMLYRDIETNTILAFQGRRIYNLPEIFLYFIHNQWLLPLVLLDKFPNRSYLFKQCFEYRTSWQTLYLSPVPNN